MSREELVAAYLGGRMSRRTLVRRLAAGGVSLSAAIAYAHELEPAAFAAASRRLGGAHFDVSVQILSNDLDRVVARESVKVRVTADRAMNVHLQLRLLRKPEHTQFTDAVVGRRTLSFPGAGTLARSIALDENPPHSLKAVKIERKLRQKARFRVLATASQLGEGTSTYFDEKTIRR